MKRSYKVLADIIIDSDNYLLRMASYTFIIVVDKTSSYYGLVLINRR